MPTDDELQRQHSQLALRLSMACTMVLSEAGLIAPELSAVLARELKRVAQLTEEADLPLAAQMNSMSGRLEGR